MEDESAAALPPAKTAVEASTEPTLLQAQVSVSTEVVAALFNGPHSLHDALVELKRDSVESLKKVADFKADAGRRRSTGTATRIVQFEYIRQASSEARHAGLRNEFVDVAGQAMIGVHREDIAKDVSAADVLVVIYYLHDERWQVICGATCHVHGTVGYVGFLVTVGSRASSAARYASFDDQPWDRRGLATLVLDFLKVRVPSPLPLSPRHTLSCC